MSDTFLREDKCASTLKIFVLRVQENYLRLGGFCYSVHHIQLTDVNSGAARGVHVGSSAPNPYTSAPTLCSVTLILLFHSQ